MISETTEAGGTYIRGTPPKVREDVVHGAPLSSAMRFRPHPGNRAPRADDRVVSIYFKAKQPNLMMRPRRSCADEYVDIRASIPPLHNFTLAKTRAVMATLHQLEQTLTYKIPD